MRKNREEEEKGGEERVAKRDCKKVNGWGKVENFRMKNKTEAAAAGWREA